MGYILKTNTATRIAVGPLVDQTDGITAETSLTVTGLSAQLYQIKNDGTAVVRTQFSPTASGGNNDMALVASSTDGMYDLELTAAQLNFLGNARVSFYDVDGFCVHWIDLHVVSAAYFNWIFGSTIPDVNATQISGDSTAADNLEAAYDGAGYAGGTIKQKVDLDTIKTQAVTCAAGVTMLAQVGAAGAPGADGGLPTTNGTKINQTVDLTAGQSIACSDKTGFSLSATGADLILKSSTFIQAIVAAINEFATYGLTALNTLLVTTGIKTATTAAPTDMAKESTLVAGVTYIDTEVASILEDTGTTLPASLAATDAKIDIIDTNVDAVLVDTGTTLPASIAGIAAAVWNYLITAMTTVGSIGAWFSAWFDSTPAGATSFGASDLEICNNSLLLLGHDPLTNLTGTDKATKLVVQFYEQACHGTLRAYPWNCALVRSAALTADSTAPAFDYDYRFPLPVGCLRVLRMSEKSYEFKVEGDWLLTNESGAQILYINDIDADEMDQLLIDAISARLAATIAFPLTNSDRTAEAMWKLYLMKLDEAQNIDAFEGTADKMEADDWVNTRL
jgi:hypothetical protein